MGYVQFHFGFIEAHVSLVAVWQRNLITGIVLLL